MSSVILLFGVLFIGWSMNPDAADVVLADTGSKIGIVIFTVWAAWHDVRMHVSRNVLRRISKEPNLYMDV